MKRALELAPRENGETLEDYPEELLNRLAEGPEMPPETSAAVQEAVRAEWRTAVENIRAPKRCKQFFDGHDINGQLIRDDQILFEGRMLIDLLVKIFKPGDKLVFSDGDVWEVTKDRRLVRQSALSEEAKFLRHLKNLGHEDVESSALERLVATAVGRGPTGWTPALTPAAMGFSSCLARSSS